METRRLYERHGGLSRCEALVLDCLPVKEGYAVVLDQTVFFPEGGGQPGDTGEIGGVRVLDTRERDGRILHITERPLEPGASAEAVLDWDRRFDHMQQHTGEHILSHAFWKLFGAVNVGFHLGREFVTIDLDRMLSQEQLDAAEDLANRQVTENRQILIYYVRPENLPALNPRKTAEKAKGDPRVVEVAGGDICPCCGTHLKSTGEVGLIKIIRHEPYKGGGRVTLLCGARALRDYHRKNRLILETGALLSVKDEGVPGAVRKLSEELREVKTRLKAASGRLMESLADRLLSECVKVLGERRVFYNGALSHEEAKLLMDRLTGHEKTAAALLFSDLGRTYYMLGKSQDSGADIKNLCALFNSVLDGRGGGKAQFMQGSAKEASSADTERLRDAFFSESPFEDNTH